MNVIRFQSVRFDFRHRLNGQSNENEEEEKALQPNKSSLMDIGYNNVEKKNMSFYMVNDTLK